MKSLRRKKATVYISDVTEMRKTVGLAPCLSLLSTFNLVNVLGNLIIMFSEHAVVFVNVVKRHTDSIFNFGSPGSAQ